MSPIKDFNLMYEALNDGDTFSDGDTVTGTVTFSLKKETKVKSLLVKVKGNANVHWSEGTGDNRKSYSSHRSYFKVKEYLVTEKNDGTVLPQGDHCFKFRLKIPQGDMPPSFKGLHGKIVYMLEAKISRSWRLPSGAQKELNFVPKSSSYYIQTKCPVSGSVEKDVGVFSKGEVQMSATVDRKVSFPGDTISVVAKICNSSSKKMRPKFSLQQRIVYRASGSTNRSDQSLSKVVGDTLNTMNSEETVSCQLKVPDNVIPTLHNCEIISVEHYVKVYLDISFAIDPEVVFPLVIIPSCFAALYPGEAVGPYPAGGVGAPSYSDFPLPAVSMGPYPAGPVGGPSNSDFPPPAVSMGPYPAGPVGGPSNSDFPAPAVSMGPYPAGPVGGPSNSDFPPPAVSMGPYPAAPHSGSYGHPGAQSYSAPPPVYPAQPMHVNGGYNNPVPQLPSPYGHPFSSPSSVLHPPPTAPAFHAPPSAPEIHPPPQFNISPIAPTYNLLPSAPAMNIDFLSQSDDAPPAYSLLFPSSATENSDAK